MKKNSVLSYYNKLALPAKASLWFMLMSVMQKGIQFLITPVYTRLLTTEEYGYYSIYVTWQSILMIIATLNLSAGVFYNGMMKFENDRKTFISSMQGLANVCTITVFVIIFAFIKPLSTFIGLDTIIIIGMFISFLLYPSFDYWSQYNRYIFNYRPLILWTVLFALVSSGLSVAFIFIIPEKKYAVILGTIVTQIVWGGIFYIKTLIEGKGLYKKEYWVFALKFNIPLIPHYLSFIILGQSDRVMIKLFCGTDAVGIYSLSYTVSLMLSIVVNAITSTFAPWTYQKLKKKDANSVKKCTNMVLIMLAAMVILCVLIAPELIKILGTEEYLQAMWIIPPVMLSCFFTMVYSLFANIEFYYEKSIYVMTASVIAAIANIILNAIFIPIYGYIAAGYTTLVCYILLALIHYLFMKKIVRNWTEGKIYDVKFITLLSVAISVISILLTFTYKFIAIRYIIITFLLIVAIIFRKKIIAIVKILKEKY